MAEKRYTSGEVAAAAGLTIRAVQYYDNIGLLRSVGRTGGGRRFYTQEDLIRLEQVILYKSLGFSLEQIRECLLFEPDQQQLLEMFERQQALLFQKMEHLHTSFTALGLMARMVNEGEELPLPLLLQALSALPKDDIFFRAQRVMSAKQWEMLSVRFLDLETTQHFYHTWKELLLEAVALLHNGSEPSSDRAQGLIKRWWEEVLSFTHGDMDVIRALSELELERQFVSNESEILASARGFMDAAFEIYAAENEVLFPNRWPEGKDEGDRDRSF